MKESVVTGLLMAAFSAAVMSCSGVPQSIRTAAAELPARADSQYAFLEDDDVRKQLVMKDALFQCKIDLEDKIEEAKSAACQCSTGHSAEWREDCKGWLGAHTPPGPSASPAPTTTAAPPDVAPQPATPPNG